jgi:hypothetical protein
VYSEGLVGLVQLSPDISERTDQRYDRSQITQLNLDVTNRDNELRACQERTSQLYLDANPVNRATMHPSPVPC